MCRRLAVAVAVAVACGMASVLAFAPAPSYDPWAWLLWGRELTRLDLSTAEGPAFKPLPVAVCALLAPLGGAAPAAWVLVARTGAALAVWLGFRIGRELGATAWAGVAAALGVVLCGGFLGFAAGGAETGWTIALGLGALAAWRRGHSRAALLCGVGCGLLRVEAWPFLALGGAVLWRRRQYRGWVVAAAVALPVLWLVPEWLGSGDVLRSGARARVPNPGQPATADVPALAALREAAALPPWPLWIGAAACLLPSARAARALLFAGLAWIALVAAMAQAGFSGEPRYSLPGGAAVAVAGAAGLATATRRMSAPRVVAGLVAVALLVAAAPKLARLDDLRRDQAWAAGLAADLGRVIAAGGGRDPILACGRPYVGDLRGPLLAYHLDVEKRRVAFQPVPPGAVFVSRLRRGGPAEPRADGFAPYARAGRWELRVRCP